MNIKFPVIELAPELANSMGRSLTIPINQFLSRRDKQVFRKFLKIAEMIFSNLEVRDKLFAALAEARSLQKNDAKSLDAICFNEIVFEIYAERQGGSYETAFVVWLELFSYGYLTHEIRITEILRQERKSELNIKLNEIRPDVVKVLDDIIRWGGGGKNKKSRGRVIESTDEARRKELECNFFYSEYYKRWLQREFCLKTEYSKNVRDAIRYIKSLLEPLRALQNCDAVCVWNNDDELWNYSPRMEGCNCIYAQCVTAFVRLLSEKYYGLPLLKIHEANSKNILKKYKLEHALDAECNEAVKIFAEKGIFFMNCFCYFLLKA